MASVPPTTIPTASELQSVDVCFAPSRPRPPSDCCAETDSLPRPFGLSDRHIGERR